MANDDQAASRRGFLKTLGLGASGAVLSPTAEAEPAARPLAPVVVLACSRVAGAEKRLSFEERLALRPGTPLVFRREPLSRYDKRAVLIELIEEGRPDRARQSGALLHASAFR